MRARGPARERARPGGRVSPVGLSRRRSMGRWPSSNRRGGMPKTSKEGSRGIERPRRARRGESPGRRRAGSRRSRHPQPWLPKRGRAAEVGSMGASVGTPVPRRCQRANKRRRGRQRRHQVSLRRAVARSRRALERQSVGGSGLSRRRGERRAEAAARRLRRAGRAGADRSPAVGRVQPAARPHVQSSTPSRRPMRWRGPRSRSGRLRGGAAVRPWRRRGGAAYSSL